MKRFYKKAEIKSKDGGHIIELDGREVKTPEKRALIIPTFKIAELICGEWNDQVDEIDTFSMLYTKMANTAVDRVESRRTALINDLVSYAGNDQLCYRADYPDDLVARQDKVWNPLLDFMKTKHDVNLKITTGIMPIEQDQKEIAKIQKLIEVMDSHLLTAFYGMTTVTGSVSIAFNMVGGQLDVDQSWNAGHLDENFQTEQWGDDEEAQERRDGLRAELECSYQYFKLL